MEGGPAFQGYLCRVCSVPWVSHGIRRKALFAVSYDGRDPVTKSLNPCLAEHSFTNPEVAEARGQDFWTVPRVDDRESRSRSVTRRGRLSMDLGGLHG